MSDVSHIARQDSQTSGSLGGSSWLVLVVAWGAMLVGSAATRVIWVEGLGYKDSPVWDHIVRLSILIILLVLTWFWPLLRQLRGFLSALLAFNIGIVGLVTVTKLPQVRALPPNLFALLTALLSVLLPVLLMSLTLIGSGLSRRDLFLTRGDMRARSRLFSPVLSPLRWTLMAPLAFAIPMILFVIELILQVPIDLALAPKILGALPVVVIFAIVNATQEEFTYRAVYLARLPSVIGTEQALLITSMNFGINHWVGGHPNGLIGAVTVALAGYILGKSMLETRGIAWAWIIHFCADMVVGVFLTMTATSL